VESVFTIPWKHRSPSRGIRTLSRDELERLFKALRDDLSFGGTNLLTIKLLLALGVRKGELLGAKWSEFDLDGATDLGPVWRLPARRTKTAAPQSIPLARRWSDGSKHCAKSPAAANSYFQSGAETAGNARCTSASTP
jgi:integrase